MRRTVLLALAILATFLALGVAVVARGDSSSVTRARLERSLPVVFSNLYVEQARIQGRTAITPGSLRASAMCDKHGADVADIGPGGDWVCLMSWVDPEVPMPSEGYGKFELNVHSNDCYTASGPSKLTGFLTIADRHGKEVSNPVFEFDGCFDPHGDNSATGVNFPSLLAVTSTALTPDAQGRVALQVTCGTGAKGCSGTVSSAALGNVDFNLKEESTASLTLPQLVPAELTEESFQIVMTDGVGPSKPVTLSVGSP